MGYVHACSFCGWTRDSATPVMLDPACPMCGCKLDAVAPADVRRPAGEHADAALPSLRTPALRIVTAVFALLLLCTAARLGFVQAGTSGGLVALGVAGFLLLPFVPDRI
jgi:hypothetical protein